MTDAGPGGRSRGRLILEVGVLLVVAVAMWLYLWSTVRPRAAYDTLWYTRIALEYQGKSPVAVTAGSWQIFSVYADPAQVSLVARSHGWPYLAPPPLWRGLYYERPVFPAVIAMFSPLLGTDAPLAASFLAALVFCLALGLLLRPLVGTTVIGILIVLSATNVRFGQWLVFLTTDGLAMAFWASSLCFAARFVTSGQRRWLLGVLVAGLALAFTRSMGIVLPLALGAPAVVGLVNRRAPWQRFVALGAVAVLPLAAFSIVAALLGWPSFVQMLQDLPTQHYHLPQVANPLPFLLGADRDNLQSMYHTARREPFLLALGGLGLVGLLLDRRPWTWPFIAGLIFLPLTQLLHPAIEEAGRTLSPMWLSVDLGLALLARHLTVVARRRFEGPTRRLLRLDPASS